MVTAFKCRRRSTLVERSVESPDTLSRDRQSHTQRFSVFNQLPRSRLERVFGSRVACSMYAYLSNLSRTLGSELAANGVRASVNHWRHSEFQESAQRRKRGLSRSRNRNAR